MRKGEIKERRIPGIKPAFYVLPSFSTNRERDRYNRIKKAYEVYLRISQEVKFCGHIAEEVVYRAIILSGSMHLVGDAKTEPNIFNNKQIFEGRALDFIATHRGTGIPLGIEVKNKRKWFHTRDPELWESLAKCVSVGVLPVFIVRKFDYLAYPIFSAIGCFGYQVHNQYYHPKVEKELADVRHKDGLGFADIRFPKEIKGGFSTEPRHIKYFKETIPKHIKDYFERYNRLLPVLTNYLIGTEFWKEPFDDDLFTEFKIEIGLLEHFEEEEPFEEFYEEY